MTHNAARPLLPASWISLIKEIIHSLSHNLQCQDDQALCFIFSELAFQHVLPSLGIEILG